MARKSSAVTPSENSSSLAAAAVMSFLKETRGPLTWTVKELQKSLLITAAQARDVIAALELQGYIKRSDENAREWLTTLNGETVSGSKPPRFGRESVEKALASLVDRIKESNKDSNSPFKVDTAVAFGDFLLGHAHAQAADVGIRLVARQAKRSESESTATAKQKRDFLKELRVRELRLNLVPFEAWMNGRSHQNLLDLSVIRLG
jgi:hypothetical protein